MMTFMQAWVYDEGAVCTHMLQAHNDWINGYVTNSDLTKKTFFEFEKYFTSLMTNMVLGSGIPYSDLTFQNSNYWYNFKHMGWMGWTGLGVQTLTMGLMYWHTARSTNHAVQETQFLETLAEDVNRHLFRDRAISEPRDFARDFSNFQELVKAFDSGSPDMARYAKDTLKFKDSARVRLHYIDGDPSKANVGRYRQDLEIMISELTDDTAVYEWREGAFHYKSSGVEDELTPTVNDGQKESQQTKRISSDLDTISPDRYGQFVTEQYKEISVKGADLFGPDMETHFGKNPKFLVKSPISGEFEECSYVVDKKTGKGKFVKTGSEEVVISGTPTFVGDESLASGLLFGQDIMPTSIEGTFERNTKKIGSVIGFSLEE
eukprot:Nk52_evm1s339 gene=Nk52_evmTU1s339